MLREFTPSQTFCRYNLLHSYHIKCILIFSLLYTLLGCTTMNGAPQSPLEFSSPPSPPEQIESEEDLLNKYSSDFATAVQTEPTQPSIRNSMISKALTIIDIRYSQFINKTELGRKNVKFASDFIELSMNLAGAAVGAAGTKTILAAISAGVNGINGSIDKNYFYEKTFPSLVAQMDADRKTKLVFIFSGMTTKTMDEYPWARAVHDLVDYYNAGTLQHAASSIAKDAGAKQKEADTQINRILWISQIATDADIIDREKLNNSLRKITDANLDKVKSILVPLSTALINLPDCKALATKEGSNTKDIKRALQLCIQNVSGETDRSFKDDNEIIANQFKNAGILP